MNIREYIRSGIIESYVLGMASEAERQEFEQMCAAYPEVAEARGAFERALEEKLMQDAQQPPVFIKDKIREQIRPVVAENGVQEKAEKAPVRRMNVWKRMADACLLLLAGVGYWAYTTNEKYQELEKQFQALQQDAETLRHPMKMVSLKGTEMAPQAHTTVFWDTTTTKDVYLLINNLPQPPSGKQYQLWAILDNKPVDLGVFDYNVQQKRLLVKMKNVQNAQAFAITLEPQGGSTTPKGEKYVAGNL